MQFDTNVGYMAGIQSPSPHKPPLPSFSLCPLFTILVLLLSISAPLATLASLHTLGFYYCVGCTRYQVSGISTSMTVLLFDGSGCIMSELSNLSAEVRIHGLVLGLCDYI
jgi:hypothetical protein